MQSSAQPGLTPGGRETLCQARWRFLTLGRRPWLPGGGHPYCERWLPLQEAQGLPLFWDILPLPARTILGPPGLSKPGWLHRAVRPTVGTLPANRKEQPRDPGLPTLPGAPEQASSFPAAFSNFLPVHVCMHVSWSWST